MNLTIDDNNIQGSFDRIAIDLLTNHVLTVNNIEFEITEIEFYYYKEKIHTDNYTHEHLRNESEWRFHNQGIDITFQGNENQDGGILIRGLKNKDEHINGPRLILQLIFENMGKVFDCNCISVTQKDIGKKVLLRTFRHLSNKINNNDYRDRHYRYFAGKETINYSKSIKDKILFDCTEL